MRLQIFSLSGFCLQKKTRLFIPKYVCSYNVKPVFVDYFCENIQKVHVCIRK